MWDRWDLSDCLHKIGFGEIGGWEAKTHDLQSRVGYETVVGSTNRRRDLVIVGLLKHFFMKSNIRTLTNRVVCVAWRIIRPCLVIGVVVSHVINTIMAGPTESRHVVSEPQGTRWRRRTGKQAPGWVPPVPAKNPGLKLLRHINSCVYNMYIYVCVCVFWVFLLLVITKVYFSCAWLEEFEVSISLFVSTSIYIDI